MVILLDVGLTFSNAKFSLHTMGYIKVNNHHSLCWIISYVGVGFSNIKVMEYFATLSLHSVNELVTFNFGAKPFKFDIKAMRLDE